MFCFEFIIEVVLLLRCSLLIKVLTVKDINRFLLM